MRKQFRTIAGIPRFVAGGVTVLAALALFLAGTVVSQRAVDAEEIGKKDPRRAFYLTPLTYDGSQALNACVAGYHMASMWEILDPSNLRYDTTLGFTVDDSGSGPPTAAPGPTSTIGWVRTGLSALNGITVGHGNCNAWTSNSIGDAGSAVGLNPAWLTAPVVPVSPWLGQPGACSGSRSVWCVQN